MKILLILVLIVMSIVIAQAFSGQQRKKLKRVSKLTYSQKVQKLQQCGLTLAPPFSFKDLDLPRVDEEGYDQVLASMGSELEDESGRFYAQNVWYFDTEAIYEKGDYKRIGDRMVQLSQGSLQLQNIDDAIDSERCEASLSFTFKGKPMKINLKVNDDWVDTSIFGHFVDLLKQSDPTKIYLYYDLGGQDCIISCVTKDQYACLKKLANFVPLN